MRLSRRLFGGGALALLAFGFLRARPGAPGLPSAARLEADLAARLATNPSGAVFRVTSFASDAQSPGRVALSAEVRLDWRPGFRVTRFAASATDAEAAYGALLARAAYAHAGVVPGFGAEARTE